jgi:hypothetical protein
MVDYSMECQGPEVTSGGWEGPKQMASITINPVEIKRFSTPDNAEPSELRELADRMEELAAGVEDLWNEMPPKLREAFVGLVYFDVEPSQGIAKYKAALRGGIWYARIKLKGEQDALFDFGIARRRLTNAVLGALERDNSAYQQALSEAVEGAFSDLEGSEALAPEETRDQLRQLSDEALRELR